MQQTDLAGWAGVFARKILSGWARVFWWSIGISVCEIDLRLVYEIDLWLVYEIDLSLLNFFFAVLYLFIIYGHLQILFG